MMICMGQKIPQDLRGNIIPRWYSYSQINNDDSYPADLYYIYRSYRVPQSSNAPHVSSDAASTSTAPRNVSGM